MRIVCLNAAVKEEVTTEANSPRQPGRLPLREHASIHHDFHPNEHRMSSSQAEEAYLVVLERPVQHTTPPSHATATHGRPSALLHLHQTLNRDASR
jgi:hypothetical protein